MPLHRRSFSVITVLIATTVFSPKTVHAEKLPLSDETLFAEADVVVVGRVTGITARTAHWNLGFGNYYWQILCSLDITGIDKGSGVTRGGQITVECWRPRYVASLMASLDASDIDHYPIPEVGQNVRAYLRQHGETYVPIRPNGLMPTGSTRFADAAIVRGLPCSTSYLLPLEAWVILGVPALLLLGIVAAVRSAIARIRKVPQAPMRCPANFNTAFLLAMLAAAAIGLGCEFWSLPFVGCMAIVAYSALAVRVFRKPATGFERSLGWGINVAFAGAVVAAIALETVR